ncbi:MAG TPA: phage terminase small subunit P27 family [Candidatus Angelobacter sp.]|nr:phage terminase small subunit P27 family [Candidatus Angelobacter sp.]
MNKTTESYRALTGAKPRKSRASTTTGTATAGRPACPRWLSRPAKAEWDRIVPQLSARGVLTKVDSMVLATYCNAVARYITAQRSVDQDGVTVETSVLDSHGVSRLTRRVNPALRVLESCERTIHKFLREFGGTPRSREQTKPAQKAQGEEDGGFDLLAALKKKHGEVE